jgi:hypothetical protein
MKKLFTLVFIMLIALASFGQKATIYPIQGQPIKANIVKIGNTIVRYHEVPDRGLGQTYVIHKASISYIQYDDNRMQIFPPVVKDTLHVGSHLKLWGVELGNSVSLGYKNETNYSYGSRFALGLTHQWGYAISPGTSIYLGGEYRLYDWSSQSDTGKNTRYSYTLNYVGINGGFHILKIRDKATWFASLTIGGGFRYYSDNNTYIHSDQKPADVGFASHSALCVGGAARFNKTVIEVGPYVDYLGYGSAGSVLGYGVKLTLIN